MPGKRRPNYIQCRWFDCLYRTHKGFKMKTVRFERIQKGGWTKRIV